MRIQLLLVATLVACTSALAADQRSIVRIADGSPKYRQALGQHFGHLPRDRKRSEIVLEVDAADWQWLQSQGYAPKFDAVLSAQLRNELAKTIPGFSCYNTVEETDAFIDAQVAAHPTLASTLDIGDSWEKTTPAGLPGYDLRLLKITNSAVVKDKPKMFLMSGLHAREYTPVQLSVKFAEWLLTNYSIDPDATWLIDHNEFHLLLQANPDGRKIAEGGVFQRKNRHNFGSCIGVDLNRNFPFYWNLVPGGSSGAQCDETYRGPSAGSEPETIAINSYVTSLFPDTRIGTESSLTDAASDTTHGMFFDIHSAGGWVLYPWGVTLGTASGNDAAFKALGRRFAWFNNYEPMSAAELYPTDGASDDNAYGKLGIPAFTFELGSTFFESCTSFNNTVLPNNLNALRYAARVQYLPYQLPSGPDAYAAVAAPTSVLLGQPVTITATANDSRFRQTNGVETIQNITSAIVTIDRLPWDPLAVALPVVAADGNFNASNEALAAQIATTALTPGRHIAFIQASDASGAVGAPASVFFTVDPTLFGDGYE